MTVRHVGRSVLQRTDQNAQVGLYGRDLRAIWDDWLAASIQRGLSTASLVARLQDAAEAHYTAAYLRGKRHAYPATTLAPEDQHWLKRTLDSNRTYLRGLASAIQDKAGLQRMQRVDLADLGRSFASRIEQQYGGALWRVTEAGYAAGVRDLAAALRLRFTFPLSQEDDPQQDDTAALIALALLLHITVSALRRMLARSNATLRDLQVADSAAARAVGSEAGVLPETVATAATEALSGNPPPVADAAGSTARPEGSSATGDDALAVALGVSSDELADIGSRAGRADGIRMGVQYIAVDDRSTCPDCRSYSEGGEGGIYWEPDEPPLPGEGRCGGRCRCVIAAVYEIGGESRAA